LPKSGSQKRHLIVAGGTRSLPRSNAPKNSGHYRRKLVAGRLQSRALHRCTSSTWEDLMIQLLRVYGRLASVFSALVIPVALACAPAFADGTPVRVRGSVVSLDGSKLVVHAKDGKDVAISLKDKFAALAVVKSSMADIKEGTFIGTATVAQPDGSLRALEVVVFPDSLRGFGEGHYPWDLGPSSMMTNATVAHAVKSVEGQTVTATYKGGEKKIDIPANVPIVGLVPADAGDITPGAIVFVPTEKQADGALVSGAVLFGKGGVIPPM
jgi:hypothetical protein